MRHRPFIVLSDDWGRWPSSSQHLFRHVAAEHDVLWVETFGMRAPRPTRADALRTVEKMASWGGREPATPWAELPARVTRFAPPLPPRPARLLSRVVRRRAAALGLRDPVLVITVPVVAGVVGQLGEAASVYYRVDDFTHWPGYAHDAIAKAEARLAASVDGLLYTTPTLDLPGFSGPRHLLDHGVAVEHFATPAPRPEGLPERGPVLLFAGRIDERIDGDLLADLPGTVVLLGRAAGPVPDGVVHLPEVSYADLPAWLQAADVLLLPYRRGAWTDTIQPLKLREYVASGTPVASTALPEVLRADLGVFVGETRQGFRDAVAEALADRRSRSARRAPVTAHTWSARSEELLAFVASLG